MLRDVTDSTFEDEVLGSKGVVLVDIWAEWCGPCKRMTPVLSSLSYQFGDKLLVAKVDADTNPATMDLLNVKGIPTMILYVRGEPIKKFVGVQPRHAIEMVISEHVIMNL